MDGAPATEAVIAFIRTYGFLAVFVYMLLETSLLLHFVPSEVVLPVAVAVLVTGPVTFAVFVGVATAGAVVGSVIAYVLFGRNAEHVLRRYGRFVALDETALDRGERWFRRWGEPLVLWGRLLPVVRALVSVPAGMAAMDRRRFVVYSTVGSLCFNTAITTLVYTGTRPGSPIRGVVDATVALLSLNLGYLAARPAILALQGSSLAVVAALVWVFRHRIRRDPVSAVRIGLGVLCGLGSLIGLLLVSFAIAAPDTAYPLVGWLWNDPAFFVRRGASPQTALVLSGSGLFVGSVGLYLVSRYVGLQAART